MAPTKEELAKKAAEADAEAKQADEKKKKKKKPFFGNFSFSKLSGKSKVLLFLSFLAIAASAVLGGLFVAAAFGAAGAISALVSMDMMTKTSHDSDHVTVNEQGQAVVGSDDGTRNVQVSEFGQATLAVAPLLAAGGGLQAYDTLRHPENHAPKPKDPKQVGHAAKIAAANKPNADLTAKSVAVR
ncbi:MAG: hypothetical protein AAF195_03650 [Pseudomonadota bacterium]